MLRKTPLPLKQKTMCHLVSCSGLLAWRLAVTQHQCKTRALSHNAPSASSPFAGGQGLTKNDALLLDFGGSEGSQTKRCRSTEMLRPRDTSFTQEVLQLLVWPRNQDHLVACCGPSSSNTGEGVCLKTVCCHFRTSLPLICCRSETGQKFFCDIYFLPSLEWRLMKSFMYT